jgi:hypothetical protein
VVVAVPKIDMRFSSCAAARWYTTWERGTILTISDSPYGPVGADGLAWYVVALVNNLDADGGLRALPEPWYLRDSDTDVGWVGIPSDGPRPLVELEPRCPKRVTAEKLLAMLPAEWLACFDEPITIEGTYGCGGCGGTGGPTALPRWLADPFEHDFRPRWSPEWEHFSVGLHFGPDGPPKPPEGSVLRVTLHVDDPAAQDCVFRYSLDEPEFIVPQRTAIDWCRERLVVDAYEVIGMDPNYP